MAMKILSEASYARLTEQNRRLRSRVAALENSNQQMVLQLGMLGYTVSVIPEVPAQPARIAIKPVRK